MKTTFAVILVAWLSSPSLAVDVRIVAGNGETSNNGDVGVATEIVVKDTFGVEVGPDGAIYVTEVGHHRIRRVDLKTNRISTIAGTGEKGYSGDGGPATDAKLNEPYELRFDAAGNIYFVEMQNHVVRRIDAKSKVVTTIAGTGDAGFSGDGGLAIAATLSRPHSIALSRDGNLYIADIGNHRIRGVHLASGNIETVAGNGIKELPVDGQAAKGNPMVGPRALYITKDVMWIALREGNSVWKLDLSSGQLDHIAGNGKKGFNDGEASVAKFNGPKGIVVDENDNAYVVDTENHVIRRIDGTTQRVTTIAGTWKPGSIVGAALSSAMNRPHGICLGRRDGTIFVGDTLNHRVLEITVK